MSRKKVEEKILIVLSALNCEIKPWIDLYKCKKIADKPFAQYADVEGKIIFCETGIGAVNMVSAVAYLAAQNEGKSIAWLNLGIAGHQHYEVGECRWIHKARDLESNKAHFPPLLVKSRLDSSAILSVSVPPR